MWYWPPVDSAIGIEFKEERKRRHLEDVVRTFEVLFALTDDDEFKNEAEYWKVKHGVDPST